jgi:hypothetical protein
MKDTVFIILFVVAMLLLSYKSYRDGDVQRERRMQLAQNAYETGCYTAAQKLCPEYTTGEPDAVQDCYDAALGFCGPDAENFRHWLEGNK